MNAAVGLVAGCMVTRPRVNALGLVAIYIWLWHLGLLCEAPSVAVKGLAAHTWLWHPGLLHLAWWKLAQLWHLGCCVRLGCLCAWSPDLDNIDEEILDF